MGTERAPREFDIDLGARLRGLREARRLSLKQVQEMSGGTIRVAALRSWETAERRIPVSKLPVVAEFYSVAMSSLLPDEAPREDEPLFLADFASEVSLTRDGWGRSVLVIDGPGLQGTAVSSSREILLALAEAYAAMRREQIRSAA